MPSREGFQNLAVSEAQDVERRLAGTDVDTTLRAHGIDTVVLGCTHYPLLKPVIGDVLGKSVSLVDPAITLEKSWVHRLPTSWNCGMPTYCTPGRPGRFVVPGLLIGAAFIAASVIAAPLLPARAVRPIRCT